MCFNVVNEVVVFYFLDGYIGFCDIVCVNEEILN